MSEPTSNATVRPQVLLAGATGYIGTHVLQELLKQGYKVKVVVRTEDDKKRLEALGAIVHVGTFEKQSTVRLVAAGCDVIISCTGFNWRDATGLSTADTIFKVLSDGNRLLHKEAVKAQCRQYILLSHLHSRDHKHDFLEYEAREEAIEFAIEQHKTSPLPLTPNYTILQYNHSFQLVDRELQRLAQQGAEGEWLAIGKGALEYRVNPISAADMAKHTVSVIDNPQYFNRAVQIGGPTVYTWLQIATACFRSLGLKPSYKYVAWWMYTVWWYLLGFVAMFGRPGVEAQVQAMGKQRLRYIGDTVAPEYGSDDLMAHVAKVGQSLKQQMEQDGGNGLSGKRKLADELVEKQVLLTAQATAAAEPVTDKKND